jgi:sulfur carrier protein ThiS
MALFFLKHRKRSIQVRKMVHVADKNFPGRQGLTVAALLAQIKDGHIYAVVKLDGRLVSRPHFNDYPGSRRCPGNTHSHDRRWLAKHVAPSCNPMSSNMPSAVRSPLPAWHLL